MLRPARRSDYKAIFEIHLQSLEGLDEEDLEWFKALLSVRSRRRKVLVAEYDGQLAGFAIAYRYRRLAYIDSIAVKPECRSMGVGSRLLAYLEDELRRDGAEVVALSVKDSNKRALDFYLRNGYQLRGIVLIMSAPVEALPARASDAFTLKRRQAGVLRSSKFKPSTWWSSLTEPVDRLVYRKYPVEEALLAYKGRRLRGVAEFSLDDELYVDYMALSSYSALEALKALLVGLRQVGLEQGARAVVIPIDASKRLIVENLLANGLRTVGTEYLSVKELV
ncbi:MAG: GNAT family N-acetyltransferase [Thermofilaceae archaeon]